MDTNERSSSLENPLALCSAWKYAIFKSDISKDIKYCLSHLRPAKMLQMIT